MKRKYPSTLPAESGRELPPAEEPSVSVDAVPFSQLEIEPFGLLRQTSDRRWNGVPMYHWRNGKYI